MSERKVKLWYYNGGKELNCLAKELSFFARTGNQDTKEGQQVTRSSYSTILDFEENRIISPRSSQSDKKANFI